MQKNHLHCFKPEVRKAWTYFELQSAATQKLAQNPGNQRKLQNHRFSHTSSSFGPSKLTCFINRRKTWGSDPVPTSLASCFSFFSWFLAFLIRRRLGCFFLRSKWTTIGEKNQTWNSARIHLSDLKSNSRKRWYDFPGRSVPSFPNLSTTWCPWLLGKDYGRPATKKKYPPTGRSKWCYRCWSFQMYVMSVQQRQCQHSSLVRWVHFGTSYRFGPTSRHHKSSVPSASVPNSGSSFWCVLRAREKRLLLEFSFLWTPFFRCFNSWSNNYLETQEPTKKKVAKNNLVFPGKPWFSKPVRKSTGYYGINTGSVRDKYGLRKVIATTPCQNQGIKKEPIFQVLVGLGKTKKLRKN